MVCRVCVSGNAKHNRLFGQLYPSSRRMAIKPSLVVFGCWRSLDYVLVLVLLLQCHSVTSQAATSNEKTTAATHTTTANLTTSAATNTATTTYRTTVTDVTATTTKSKTTAATNTATTTNRTTVTEVTATNAETATTTTDATIAASNPFTSRTTIFTTSLGNTHELSSTANTTMTTSQTTSALTTASVPCSFSQSCNQTFYWMVISVPSLSAEVEEWFIADLEKCGVQKNEVKFSMSPNSSIRETLHDVLLMLGEDVDVCCIKQKLRTADNFTVVREIEGVGVSLNTTQIPSGSLNICNQTVSSVIQNSTCGNNTNTVTLLDYQESHCPTNSSTPSKNSCDCFLHCNSSHAYYSFNVNMSAFKVQFNLSTIPCENMSLECTFIVKLSTTMDKLDVQKDLEAITGQNVSVTRLFLYSCSRSSNDSCFDDFCNSQNTFNCSEGLSIAVLLNDSCNSSQTFLNSSTTPPATTASTYTSVVDADGLLSMAANASALNSSQVELIISQLETLMSRPNVSLALANTSVSIVNNLLDVPVAVMTPFSSRASGIVDKVGLKLVVSGETESMLSSSLALAVKKVNGNNFQETTFFITDPSSLQIRSDSRLRRDAGQVSSVPLGSITLPASLTQNLSVQEQQVASRVQFNFYQKSTFFQDKELGKHELISGILSASVANLSISNLQKNVSITLRTTKPTLTNITKDNNSTLCVFWDFALNGGAGGWNTSGCHVLSSNDEETQCTCNHLTSFGVLLIISQNNSNSVHYTILTYITYIGCGISAIFLSVTLLTYLGFGKLRNDIPSKILIQLCLALLLLNMVFLVDSWLAQYPEVDGLCISTAFFLHYFLLASFTWMAMEAVHMYLALVKVFNTYISRFMLKIGLAGWGIPLIVVVIVIATNKVGKNYGLVSYGKFIDGTPDHFCWITNDIVFYVAVVTYFGLVFLLNFTMFIVVLVQLCRIKRQNPQNVQNRSSWQELRSVAGLTVLLGLAWGFAFFAWNPVNLPFMYLFAIFNSLQGFFIFVFHCAMKENVRRQWRTYLCCGKYRLPENSEWSRTATQRIKKASKKRPSSTQSNNSRTSFLQNDSISSDMPMGISNPAASDPGSDVVMNEINAMHRGKKSN